MLSTVLFIIIKDGESLQTFERDSISLRESWAHCFTEYRILVKKKKDLEGAKELNHFMPFQWADVIIMYFSRTVMEGREHLQKFCRYVGVVLLTL